MADISVEHLLEEQKRSSNIVIIDAVPDDKHHVRVIPWYPGLKCICGSGAILPLTAIQEITKTGKTIRCCNRTLQIVEVAFSDEKLVTGEELLNAMRASRSEAMQSARRRLTKLRAIMRFHLPIYLPPFPIGNGPEGGFGDGEGDGFGEGDSPGGTGGGDPFCVSDCITKGMKTSGGDQLKGPAWTQNFKYWQSLCSALCGED